MSTWLPQIKQSKDYDKENCNRQLILEAGFYEPITSVESIKIRPVLQNPDIGCGEGYYSRKLQEALSLLLMPLIFPRNLCN